jgi:hypothetical protein
MEAAEYPLTIEQGSTFKKHFRWRVDGQVMNLTGYSAKMHARRRYGGELGFELSTENNRILLGGTDSTGTVFLEMSSEETAALPVGNFVYDLELYAPSISSPPPPPPPLLHEVFDGPLSVNPADGSRGYAQFVDSFSFSALPFFGFKLGPATRIRNCKITLIRNNYVAEFGVSTNWDLIKYFSAHDIVIDSSGIGRSGFGNFGNGWAHDVMGFYLDIPPEKLLSETGIIVDYEYTTDNGFFTDNKNGVGFWSQVSNIGGPEFSIDSSWIGSWAVGPVYLARLPSNLSSNVVTPPSKSFLGTFYNRRIVIKTGSEIAEPLLDLPSSTVGVDDFGGVVRKLIRGTLVVTPEATI